MTITVDTTEAFDQEMASILAITDLETPAKALQVAFTLLRIHVDVARSKGAIGILNDRTEEVTYRITLPCKVIKTTG
jgi:hypothetical protein